MKRRRVLLWGGKGAGKSGFLGALWHLDVDQTGPGGTWAISPTADVGDRATKEYLTSAHQALLDEERRPTAPAAHYPVLKVTVRKWVNGHPVGELPLGFRDPAGEFADDASRARDQGGALLDDMVNAGGIIWLFDCTGASTPDFTQVMRQLTSVRQRNRNQLVHTPLALCLSKIDQLDDAALQRARETPAAALEQAIGSETFDLFRRTFTNIECFAISSKGLTPGEIQPVGLSNVLNWIDGQEKRKQRVSAVKKHWKSAVIAVIALLVVGRLYGAVDNYLNGEGRERRERQERDILARLETAELMYASGATDSVVALLAAVKLPKRHPRSIALDTLLAISAFESGMAQSLGDDSDQSRLELSRLLLNRALDGNRIADPAAQARLRFIRANACIALDCERRQVRRDLDFVVEHGKPTELRRKATALLEDLR